VLTNLLQNAIKYSPAGGEILVTVQREDDSAVLGVRDHGLGIPAADQPHIFERFRRGANVRGSIGGTGIGLAGVRSLVESHGGTVGFESQEGSGSTFRVRLPLRSPAGPASASSQSEPDAADPGR
jgi:signal transduction histidine kinase